MGRRSVAPIYGVAWAEFFILAFVAGVIPASLASGDPWPRKADGPQSSPPPSALPLDAPTKHQDMALLMLEDARAWAARNRHEESRRIAGEACRLIANWPEANRPAADVIQELRALAGIVGADKKEPAEFGDVSQASLQMRASEISARTATNANSSWESSPTPAPGGERNVNPLVSERQPAPVIVLSPPGPAPKADESLWNAPHFLWPVCCFLAGVLAIPVLMVPVCLVAARCTGQGGALLRIEIVRPSAPVRRARSRRIDERERPSSGTAKLRSSDQAVRDHAENSLIDEPSVTNAGNEDTVSEQEPRPEDLFGQIIAMNLALRRTSTGAAAKAGAGERRVYPQASGNKSH